MEFTCPCCQKRVTEAKLSNIIELLKSNACEYEATDDFPMTFALPHSKWACDDCLKNKKAVLSDINKQSYSILVEATRRPFHLVYAPWESVCKRCQKTFEVSIEQQQHTYEVLKMPVRMAPTHCLDCEGKPPISRSRRDLTMRKSQKPLTKKKLNKHIAAAKADNDLEKVQQYQLMLDKVNLESEAKTRKQIADLTQKGPPTDVRAATKLAALYQLIDDKENLEKCNKRIKYLKWEWWDKNIKPTLDPESIVVKKRYVPKKQKKSAKAPVKDTPVDVESQPVLEQTSLNIPVKDTPVEPSPVLETTPIQVKDTPIKKAKKIQKPVLEPTPLNEPVKDTPIEPPVLEPTPIPVKINDTLVEPLPIIETTPIQVNEEPIKKAKKKRIVKSIAEPESLKLIK